MRRIRRGLRSEHQSLRHRALIVDEDRECDAPPELFEIRGGIGTLLANDIGNLCVGVLDAVAACEVQGEYFGLRVYAFDGARGMRSMRSLEHERRSGRGGSM